MQRSAATVSLGRYLQATVALLSIPWLLSGCAGLTTRQDLREQQRSEAQPPAPPSRDQTRDQTRDQVIDQHTEWDQPFQPSPPTPVQMPKVGLILGPGSFKSFAHAGVLKELHKARIPIDVILGLEWGALVAGLYAQNGQIHEVEWKLYRMEQSDLPQRGGLFRRRADSLESLRPFLSRQFQVNNASARIENAKIHFACPSLSLNRGSLQWQSRGSFAEAMNKCLPFPPLFRPEGEWSAASFALTEAAEYMRAQGVNLIILVNVLSAGELLGTEALGEDPSAVILWQELRRAMSEAQKTGVVQEVIEVNTRAHRLQDFEQRKRLVSAGERAGQAAARRLAEKYGF